MTCVDALLLPLLTSDFYEEMLSLLDLFTTISISPQMWQMLFVMYDAFTRDGYDYFTGMQYYTITVYVGIFAVD